MTSGGRQFLGLIQTFTSIYFYNSYQGNAPETKVFTSRIRTFTSYFLVRFPGRDRKGVGRGVLPLGTRTLSGRTDFLPRFLLTTNVAMTT